MIIHFSSNTQDLSIPRSNVKWQVLCDAFAKLHYKWIPPIYSSNVESSKVVFCIKSSAQKFSIALMVWLNIAISYMLLYDTKGYIGFEIYIFIYICDELFEISHYCHWCFSINGKLLPTNFEITMPFIFRWMILVILKMTLEICTLSHYYFVVLLSSYIFIIAIHIKSFYCTKKSFAKQVPFIIYIKVLHNSTDSILTKRIMSIYLGISLHWQYLYNYLGNP